MENNKKLTILHSNDFHDDLFFRVDDDYVLHGGIAMLSDYVKKARNKDNDIMYCICGDSFQNDIMNSNYKGLDTIKILNYLKPDAMSLGNHEMDYGLAHALILDRCLTSPLINANITEKSMGSLLFEPSVVVEKNGLKILLIGLFSRIMYERIESDYFNKAMMGYVSELDAIEKEIKKHENDDIDMIVLMTHSGLAADLRLAGLIPPEWNVKVILGGHDHITMEKAEMVNGILVAQVAFGTRTIGRFDLTFDKKAGCLTDWKWERVELTSEISGFDQELEFMVDQKIEQKMSTKEQQPVCIMKENYTHPNYLFESSLGDIIADTFLDNYDVDLAIVPSGSIRLKECPQKIYMKEMKQIFPFDARVFKLYLSGKEIKDMFAYLMSLKDSGDIMTGFFQYSRGFCMEVDFENYKEKGGRITKLTLNGEEFEDDRKYTVCVTEYCMKNFNRYFRLNIDDTDPERAKLVSYSAYHDLIKGFLKQEAPIMPPVFGRFIFDANQLDL